MSVRLRLSRAGSKKRPYYHIVAADQFAPRDGRFLEQVGSWNPMLPKDAQRVTLNEERIKVWLDRGAQPTDRVLRFLAEAGLAERATRSNLKKGVPGKKAQERAEERRQKAEDAKAAAAEAEAPAESGEAEASEEAQAS